MYGYIYQDANKKLTLVREPLQFIFDHVRPEYLKLYLNILSCGDNNYKISCEELDNYIDILVKLHNEFAKTDNRRIKVEELFFESYYGPYGDIDYSVDYANKHVIVSEEFIFGYLTHCIIKDCKNDDIYAVLNEIENHIESFREKCFGFIVE